MLRFVTLFLAVLSLPCSSFADPPSVFALTGGTVHPVASSPIEGGVVILRDGLIEAVGAGLPVPSDATAIDVRGLHVYPGLFDAQTSIGLAAASKADPDWKNKLPITPVPGAAVPSAALNAGRLFTLTEDDLDARRRKGVTTVVVAALSGVFTGQSAVINLSGGSPASMILRSPASIQVTFNPRTDRSFPDSLMGTIAYLRQRLLDAQQHQEAWVLYNRNPLNKQRPEPSEELDALRPILRREIPLVFAAESENAIRRSAAVAAEFNVRWIVTGARQAYRMVDDLARLGAPVLLSVNYLSPPERDEVRNEESLRSIRDRQESPGAASLLARKNVKFALVSAGASGEAFMKGIRRVIEQGLSERDALRAVTLTPAEIFGVERQVGSLERGKIANVVVTEKPIFDMDMRVRHLFIDGRLIRVSEESKEKTSGSTPVDGTWSLSVRTSEGELPLEVTLRADGSRLSGSFSGPRGSGDLAGGSIEGNQVRFVATMKAGAETSDWTFTGTIRDGEIRGSVATTTGSFPFTGSKPQ